MSVRASICSLSSAEILLAMVYKLADKLKKSATVQHLAKPARDAKQAKVSRRLGVQALFDARTDLPDISTTLHLRFNDTHDLAHVAHGIGPGFS